MRPCAWDWQFGTPSKAIRTQRDLLQAATIAASEDEIWTGKFPKAKDDIEWLLKKLNALSDNRNSAIHAPMFAPFGGLPEIRPLTMFRNPNAAKLVGKDFFIEFEWYEKYFKELTKFAAKIFIALKSNDKNSWPDKPLLPTVGQKNTD